MSPKSRRKSLDSSDSDSGSGSESEGSQTKSKPKKEKKDKKEKSDKKDKDKDDKKYKDKDDKKDKDKDDKKDKDKDKDDKKDKDKDGKKDKDDKKHKDDSSHSSHATNYGAGHSAGINHAQMPLIPHFPSVDQRESPQIASHQSGQAAPAPPASGYRIPLTASDTLPSPDRMGPAPCVDGSSPVYIGSALFDRSVHPCKISPYLPTPCSVVYGGGEIVHQGRYDLLPFDPNTMEFVHTSDGHIPAGRHPVEGG